MFALRTVEVEGVPANVRRAILESLEETRGTSLVSLDGDAVVRRLEALPSVQSVTYDRAFPHTLRLVVVPEEPVAVVKQASNLWIVSARGRVIGPTSAAEVVTGAADLNANVIFGAVIDEGMHGKVRVTVIATGFDRALRRDRREREDLELNREREPVSGGFDVPADVLEVPSFLRRR